MNLWNILNIRKQSKNLYLVSNFYYNIYGNKAKHSAVKKRFSFYHETEISCVIREMLVFYVCVCVLGLGTISQTKLQICSVVHAWYVNRLLLR